MIKDFSTNSNISNDDEIDIGKYILAIQEEKKVISIISAFTTLFCILIYTNIKPTWIGRFQIVVKEENSSIKKDNNPFSSGTSSILSQLGVTNQSKRTQELILKSPSVLMPVYNFNKAYSEANNIKIEDRSFDDWFKKSLNISFEKGSNVLTIDYKSTDKKLIIETLDLVSKKYQNYAKINKARYVDNIINYLSKQKDTLKDKSNISMEKFNSFTIENRLANVDGFYSLEENTNDENRNNFSIENLMNSKKNKIKLLDDKKGSRFEDQFKLLDQYETEYIILSSSLKPNSEKMISLKNKIENLRDSLKRPNQILIKYRQLKTKALRDEKNLSSILSELDSYKLERALQPLPWDLISKPTIKKKQIFPNLPFLFALISLGVISINSLFLIIKKFLNKKS